MTQMLLKTWAKQDKRLANLTARAALRGIALYLLDDGTGGNRYQAVYGFWEHDMYSMDEVDAFLSQFERKQ